MADKNKKQKANTELLHSPAIQAIFGTPPRWIVRWGISVICGVFLLLISGSILIRYPEIIRAEIHLMKSDSPLFFSIETSPNYDSLFLVEVDSCQSYETLLLFEHGISSRDLMRIRTYQKNADDTRKSPDGNSCMIGITKTDDFRINGEIRILEKDVGKIHAGQDLNIKLDAYPYMEYGTIRAKIQTVGNISIWKNEKMFRIADIESLDSLSTCFGKKIPFRQGMTGTAEIVTKKTCFFDKVVRYLRI